MHEHIHRLRVLLSPLKERYHFDETFKRDHCFYEVKMVAGTISGAIDTLKEEMTSQLKEGDEIRIIADTALYGDQDIVGEEFQGVNIVCIAPQIINVKEEGEFHVITDGKQLVIPPNPILNPADDGENGTPTDKAGKRGTDGLNGCYGNPGGQILIITNKLIRKDFVLSANGSQGHDGQDGGNGGDGWTPEGKVKDGEDKKFEKERGQYGDYVLISYGTHGENGGPGGGAGLGGAPGKSGVSGKIQLIDLNDKENDFIEQNKIEDGKPGKPGKPGMGGKNIRHGKDYGAYAEHAGIGGRIFNVFFKSDWRDVHVSPRAELRHPAIPEPGYGEHFIRPGKGLPKQNENKGENHPDFKDRGHQQAGTPAQTKVNSAITKENRAVDKRACLKLAQRLCKKTAQHWNSTSHNRFFGSFAQRLGETQKDIFGSMTHSDVIHANIDVYIERIQNQFESMKSRQLTRRHTKVQVQMMKDFVEVSTPTSLGYIGSDKQLETLTLDVSPLKAMATLRNIDLEDLTLHTLLLSNENDEMVENLDDLLRISRKPFVLVSCHPRETNGHRSEHSFLIVRDRKGNYQYHYRNECFTINALAIVRMLNRFMESVEDNEVVVIERDDIFDQPMIQLVQSKLGTEVTVPSTNKQSHCLEQLNLLVTIKKTYHAMASKYNEIFDKRQALRKVYGEYLDEVLTSESMESLMSIEQNMLQDNLLILPLEIPCFCKDDANSLYASVEIFNRQPTLTALIDVVVAFHSYHLDQTRNTETRYGYIMHLTESLVPLENLFNQLSSALKIFCDQDQISEHVSHLSFSESFMYQINVMPTFHEANLLELKGKLTEVCERPSVVYTIVDYHVNNLIECVETTIFDSVLPRPKQPDELPHDLSFEESYAAFQSIPCSTTVLPALEVYVKQLDTKPPAKFKYQLHHILDSVYEVIQLYLNSFDLQASVVDFVEWLDGDNIKPSVILENVESIVGYVSDKTPLYSKMTALLELLRYFHQLVTLPTKMLHSNGTDNEEESMDPKSLLISIPEILEEIHTFCESSVEHMSTIKDDKRKDLIETFEETFIDLNKVVCIHNTLHKYPMATSVVALREWEQSMKAIRDFVKSIIVQFNSWEHDLHVASVYDQFKIFNNTLEECISGCSSLAALNENLQWIKNFEKLEQFSKLHGFSESQRLKLMVEKTLCLDSKLHSTTAMDAVSNWLKPGLLWPTPKRIILKTCRLNPKHDVFIQAKQPKKYQQVLQPTIYLFPDGVDIWQLGYQEQDESLQFRGVDHDLIQKMLGKDAIEKVRKDRKLAISVELKAELLIALGYEEQNIQHNASFNGQLLVDEINSEFSLLVINMKDGRIVIHQRTNTKDIRRRISDDDILVVQGQCCTSTESLTSIKTMQELLGISDEQLSSLESAAGLCLIKHPDQPVLIKTVSHCGEEALFDFSYCMPLITDCSIEADKTYSEQFQPLSDLLNSCIELYHALLPWNNLHSALKDTFAQYTSIYHTDIPILVRTVRCHFITQCVKDCIIRNEVQNIQMMQNLIDMLLNDHSNTPILLDVNLTGLEAFVYYLLMRREPTENDANYLYWQEVMEGEKLSSEEMNSICLALSYLHGPDGINHTLHNETVFFRFHIYDSIMRGLKHLQPIANASYIEELLEHVLVFQTNYKMDALCEVSTEIKDQFNIEDLLKLLRSDKDLERELFNCVNDESLNDKDECYELLENHVFFEDLYAIVLCWSMDKQKPLVEGLQNVVSRYHFANDSQKETLIATISSWLLNMTEKTLSEYLWKDLTNLYHIAQLFSKAVSSAMLKDLQFSENESCSENPDLIHKWLTFIQVVEINSDVGSVLSMMLETPPEQWTKKVLVQNFLVVCVEYFDIAHKDDKAIYIDTTKEKMLRVDPILLQILYNVFIEDQYNSSAAERENDTFDILTLSQLLRNLDWLSLIEHTPDAYSALCKTTITMWENELIQIHFKQYLDFWEGLQETPFGKSS